jgi:Na+/glutamate symporter
MYSTATLHKKKINTNKPLFDSLNSQKEPVTVASLSFGLVGGVTGAAIMRKLGNEKQVDKKENEKEDEKEDEKQLHNHQASSKLLPTVCYSIATVSLRVFVLDILCACVLQLLLSVRPRVLMHVVRTYITHFV